MSAFAASSRASNRQRLFDTTLALFSIALSISLLAPFASSEDPSHLALAVVLLVGHSGCLAWRRRAPHLTLLVNATTGVAFILLGYPAVFLGIAILVALYSVASFSPRRISLPALARTVIVMGIGLSIDSQRPDLGTIFGNAAVLAAIWFMGDSHRERRIYVERLEERTQELEQAREELARSAVAEERLRIARELHDVLAHSLGMIAVQSGVGAHVIESRPKEAERSLRSIEQASKSARAEVRRMLGLLRSTDDPAATTPSPGLAELASLVDEVSRTGLNVALQMDDWERSIPEGVQLTIYRIVQEALTNVVKHAGATTARVNVTFSPDVVRLQVVDDGTAKSNGALPGHGVVGMRERAAMHGGSLQAEALPERGFKVSATIPIEAS